MARRKPPSVTMSRVPKFRGRRTDKLPFNVVLECTRCNCEFAVNWTKFKEASAYATRPCPFCFKVSRIS